MEQWKKLVNHAIELLDKSHGQEVKAFYRSIGVNIGAYEFKMAKSNNDYYRYYAIFSNDRIDNISLEDCERKGIKIVTLDEAKAIVNGTTIKNSLLPQNTETLFATKKISGKVLL